MKKYVNEVTGNLEIETSSVLKTISDQPTGTTPNGKNFYSVTADIEFNGKTQKNIRGLIFEGNINAAGGLDKMKEKISSEESLLTRVAKGTDGRPPLVILSHLPQGSNLDDAEFVWEDMSEEVQA